MAAPTGQTLFLPKPRTSAAADADTGLPTDLITQSAYRLRTLALLYAFVFFMAGFFPALLFDEARAEFFSHVLLWLPGTIAISMALVVASIACSKLISLHTSMTLGLAFEVVGSFAIATSEFLDPMGHLTQPYWIGLSWVSVWTMLFTVVVPTSPRRAVVAALLSVSAVPIVVSLAAANNLFPAPSGLQLFFAFTFPYLLIVLMAYVGSQVVYGLGREVSRARELGSYLLVEKIGQGGMGEVWRAKHRMLARPAAIKLIRHGADGGAAAASEMRRRFELEANTIAGLRSPHTVNLYDFGVAPDGAFYYVMELLDGLDADSLVRKWSPLPAERAIHVLGQICHSLSEAHSHGLVHRDIKPANIFLCRYGEDVDFVKVLDFGIVKAVHDAAETKLSQLTIENAVRGTPAFIAPEQALGANTIDARADIYSIGCVAYWLLTGELVFTAETSMGLLIHHAHTEPVSPSSRTTRPIPAELEALVMACLSKDPAKRPQSARELASQLELIDHAPRWTADRAREWWAERGPVRAS